MNEQDAFVTIDNEMDDAVLIDLDDTLDSNFVMIDESLDDTDFISLSDDVEIASDHDIIDITSGMDDMDVSIIL